MPEPPLGILRPIFKVIPPTRDHQYHLSQTLVFHKVSRMLYPSVSGFSQVIGCSSPTPSLSSRVAVEGELYLSPNGQGDVTDSRFSDSEPEAHRLHSIRLSASPTSASFFTPDKGHHRQLLPTLLTGSAMSGCHPNTTDHLRPCGAVPTLPTV